MKEQICWIIICKNNDGRQSIYVIFINLDSYSIFSRKYLKVQVVKLAKNLAVLWQASKDKALSNMEGGGRLKYADSRGGSDI